MEKLILLADLFGITLDELVKGGAMLEVQAAEEKQTAAAAPKGYSTQKIIAVCLLLLGGIAAILGAALCPELLYLAGYLLLCSIVCFVVKRYAGLVIAWPTVLGLALTAPYLFSVPVDFCVRWGSLTVAVLWTIWEVHKGRKKCA